jgi:tetratricopeptide (TPR) repeat protein
MKDVFAINEDVRCTEKGCELLLKTFLESKNAAVRDIAARISQGSADAMQKAVDAAQTGNPTELSGVVDDVMSKYGYLMDVPRLRRMKIGTYRKAGQKDAAAREIEALERKTAQERLFLAEQYAETDKKKMQELVEDVLADTGAPAWVLRDMALVALKAAQPDLAGRCLEFALAQDPMDAKTFLYEGHLFLSTGRFDAAIAAYERSMSLDPEDPNAALNLASLHSRLMDDKKALFYLARAQRQMQDLGDDVGVQTVSRLREEIERKENVSGETQ